LSEKIIKQFSIPCGGKLIFVFEVEHIEMKAYIELANVENMKLVSKRSQQYSNVDIADVDIDSMNNPHNYASIKDFLNR
jgi:hypothetical protein